MDSTNKIGIRIATKSLILQLHSLPHLINTKEIYLKTKQTKQEERNLSMYCRNVEDK